MALSTLRTPSACTCCGDILRTRFDRRRFLVGAASIGLAAAVPLRGFAAEGQYEAMLLTCIDPRFQEPVRSYTNKRELTNKYSQFTIAGAAIGVVAPKFEDWHKTFWDNLAASIELHRVPKMIAIDHRDCGAARIAYGDASIATPKAEDATHKAVFAEFRTEMTNRHPKLAVETGLMALDGSIEMLG
jgi:hypothetical protein